MDKLTKAESRFVTVLLATGSRMEAAQASGIPAHDATRRLHVEQAIRDRLARFIVSAAPMALRVLEELASDPTVIPAVRRLAASDILDRAGLGKHSNLLVAQPAESISELPAHALRALVERLETELFARSKDVQVLELRDDSHDSRESRASVLD